MGEHTPTPWRVIVEADRLDEPCIVAPDHSDDFSRFVATCHGGLCDNEQEQHANAAFIVEAVNSYDRNRAAIDALVGALEACRRELNIVRTGTTDGIPNAIIACIPEAIELADAALLASKEGM